jgi:hypothetical protein
MSEKSETQILSRRTIFSILGLATLALSVPPTVLMVSPAEAQAPSPAPTTAAPQTGRQQRRLARRQARTERRQTRRQARTERRQTRRGANPAQ